MSTPSSPNPQKLSGIHLRQDTWSTGPVGTGRRRLAEREAKKVAQRQTIIATFYFHFHSESEEFSDYPKRRFASPVPADAGLDTQCFHPQSRIACQTCRTRL